MQLPCRGSKGELHRTPRAGERRQSSCSRSPLIAYSAALTLSLLSPVGSLMLIYEDLVSNAMYKASS